MASETRESVKNRLSLQDLIAAYGISDRLHRVRIKHDSSIAAMTVAQAAVQTRYGVTVLGIERRQHRRPMIIPAGAHTVLKADDIIFVVDTAGELDRMVQAERLEHLNTESAYGKVAARELGVAEVPLIPRSTLICQTLDKARFRERYGLTAVGILRNGKPVEGNLVQTELLFGDSMLVGGGWRQIELLAVPVLFPFK